MVESIPQPPGYPLLGNLYDVDPEHPLESLGRLADVYGGRYLWLHPVFMANFVDGPIFRLNLPSERIFVGSYALAEALFDEKRFQKSVSGPLEQVRNGVKDGLFTAYAGEHNWVVAHGALMPAFGPLNTRGMFDEMQDICSQLVLKWARFGPDHAIHVTDDFTRLTLDSIALCAMGTRFNSFYRDEMNPFVKAMLGLLTESFARTRRPGFLSNIAYRQATRQYEADIKYLETVARDLLTARRNEPTDKKDLLNAMLFNKDPKTGENLNESTIINNMITFLIAGHETTSGLLSFLFYELLHNPSTYQRAQKEVDELVGTRKITVDDMSKLPYLTACLRESLRLHPPAPSLGIEAKGDQIIGGKYLIKDKQSCSVLLTRLHRDPEVWGSDAEEFKPERMLDELFSKLPRHAWKPFGNGQRSCIGRPFAWQEALLAAATLLQVFQLSFDMPSYTLQVQTNLTIKPKDFYMRARLRHPDIFNAIIGGSITQQLPVISKQEVTTPRDASNPSLLILYGSNTGTCEALANSLASAATTHGFNAKVDTLDSAATSLPKGIPVAIITASYEGQPADNAGQFCAWLESASDSALEGVKYAVFGCGNKEWSQTYQRIPNLIDESMADKGAKRLSSKVTVDVNSSNVFNVFDDWQDNHLWPSLEKALGRATPDGQNQSVVLQEIDLQVDVQGRSQLLRQDVQAAQVVSASLLTAPGITSKRSITIRLPTGVSYKTGDYLAILPVNPSTNVRRVMSRFNLPWDATITIKGGAANSLPKDRPVNAYELFAGMVELSQPATAKQVLALSATIEDPEIRKRLEHKAGDAFTAEIQDGNVSLLDLLEDYPMAHFTLGQYLAAVPPMRVRQYSVSSSPVENGSFCSLTYSVINAPAKGTTSKTDRRFLGVASTYLERLQAGDHVQVALRPSRSGFHLPLDDTIPIVMACAGTGLAPFRAFVAERALKKQAGKTVGPALLFYGCQSPDKDDLYRDEFDRWESQGVVQVLRAFSKQPDKSENCKYVQDRMWHDREAAAGLFKDGAKIYMCGSGAVGSAVGEVMVRIYKEGTGSDEQTAQAWLEALKGERYWTDVFS